MSAHTGRNGSMSLGGFTIAGGGAAAAALLLCACASPAAAGEVVRLREGAAADLIPIAQQLSEPAPNASPLSLAPPPRRSLELDSNGRWGLRLDLAQPASRDQDFRDVQAGAYLRLGPRLRVGGTVGLNSQTPGPQAFRPQDAAPKVRLETNFKF